MLLGFLGTNSRTKAPKRTSQERPPRPTGFYQAFQPSGEYLLHNPSAYFIDQPVKDQGVTDHSENTDKLGPGSVGSRVIASGERAGVLKFYGQTELGPGNWCGIELDAPVGQHDGSVKGIRYFTCTPSHGLLLPETGVTLVTQVKGYISDVSDSGPHSLLGVTNEDFLEKESQEDNAQTSGVVTDYNPRHSGGSYQSVSRISTPGSCNSGTQFLEASLSSKNSSSTGSLVPRPTAISASTVHDLQHSKHSSFELDESLGILTPDQMTDFGLTYGLEDSIQRTPSDENLSSLMLQDIELSDLTVDSSVDTKRNSIEVKPSDFLPEANATYLFEECHPYMTDDTLNRESEESRFSSLTIVNSDRSLGLDVVFPKDLSEEAELSESLITSKKTSEVASSSSIRTSKKDTSSRLDRTPSLEDLPMDLALDLSAEDPKTDPGFDCSRTSGKSAVPPTSFITSITSITSLDNGYQGDGEWSRPASRGADHSPSAHQKVPKGRLDPMTDSDFFTESDADMFEEGNAQCGPSRGDRKAQVIDGTLYGVINASANAPMGMPVNGQAQPRFSPTNEDMDSSGIYSDLERKCEEPNWEVKSEEADEERGATVVSPEGSIKTVSSKSDQSLKKISPTIFSHMIQEQVNTIKNLVAVSMESDECPTEVISESVDSECSAKKARSNSLTNSGTKTETNFVKKYKMPKRNVVSKIKTMITSGTNNQRKEEENQENRVPSARPAKKGRWDAVMSKIAQGQAEEKTTPKLKEVKSKVFSGISLQPTKPSSQDGTGTPCRKAASTRCLSSAQSISTRSLRDITTIKNKCRRSRMRSSESSLQGQNPNSQNSSRNSSISDISQSKHTPTPRSGKKRESSGRCTSPQSDISTQSQAQRKPTNTASPPQNTILKTPLSSKNASGEKNTAGRKTTPRRSTTSVTTPAKPTPLRDQNRVSSGASNGVSGVGAAAAGRGVSEGAGKGGGRAPSLPPPLSPKAAAPETRPAPPPPLPPDPKALSALKHASNGFQALSALVNYLVFNLDAFSTPRLKSDLEKIKAEWLRTKLELEETKASYSQLDEQFNTEKVSYQSNLEELVSKYEEQNSLLRTQHSAESETISKMYEKKLADFEEEHRFKELSIESNHKEALEELKRVHRIELETLRGDKEREIDSLRFATKELNKAVDEGKLKEVELEKRISDLKTDYDNLKQKSNLFLNSINMDRDSKFKAVVQQRNQLESEVDSLRTVLELRCNELQELRRQSQVWQREAEQLPQVITKNHSLISRVEDLQAQLLHKESQEQQLVRENQLLLDTVNKESSQKKRLSMHNEELQWKLKQNTEVVNALAALSSVCDSPGSVPAYKSQKSPRSCSKRSSYNISKTPSDADINGARYSDSFTFNAKNYYNFLEKSPPSSPKIKSIVEKSDSVAYVLDIDDPPEQIASRILKRAQSLKGSATSTPTHNPRGGGATNKQTRSRSSKSLTLTSPSKFIAECGGGDMSSIESEDSPAKMDNSNWDHHHSAPPTIESTNHITEEVIIVKSIGNQDVLELLDVDNSEIHIEDLPLKEKSDFVNSNKERKTEEERQMIRRVEESQLREGVILPKDSAGEAMISGEASDEDDDEDVEDEVDSEEEEEDETNSEDIYDDKYSDKDSDQNDNEVNLREREIKLDAKVVKRSLSPLNGSHFSQLSSLYKSALDASWSEESEVYPSES